jgi:uncharacterized protein
MTSAEEERIESLVQRELSARDVAHGLDHARAVARNVRWILKDPMSVVHADERVTLAAAWFHDVRSRDEAGFDLAASESAQVASRLLCSLGFSAEERERVAKCIETASWEHHLTGGYPASTEAEVLRDADWLEAMGAVGIARVFAFSGMQKLPLSFLEGDPEVPERLPTNGDGPDPSPFHHFYSKLLWLRDGLTTRRGRLEGEHRHRTLVRFLKHYEEEVSRTSAT